MCHGKARTSFELSDSTKVEAKDSAREIDPLRGFFFGLITYHKSYAMARLGIKDLGWGFTFGFCSE